MPKILKMPTESELPPGPWRDFVQALFRYYRAADRPDLRAIEAAVQHLPEDQQAGSASRETIRQMLRGRTVARQWLTAATVLFALCHLAGIDPNDFADGLYGYGSDQSHLSAFKELWLNAADAPRPPSEAEVQAQARARAVSREAERVRGIMRAVASTQSQEQARPSKG